jgi:uncharacterized membrane protein YphA (DoxX/SURF4 family)
MAGITGASARGDRAVRTLLADATPGYEMILFMHNLALMGGVLMVIAFGPGTLSIDHRARSLT